MVQISGSVRKYAIPLILWSALLFAIALFQNYLRYGQSEEYNILNSIIYLAVTIIFFLPFALWGVWQMGKGRWSLMRSSLWAFSAILAHYIFGSILIHLLGIYHTFFEVKFARQYFGREAFFHALSMVVLGYFVSKESKTTKIISGTLGRREVTLQADRIRWIEADDHYLKIYTKDSQLMKRATLENMADHLSPDFIRIHRKYLVNRQSIVGKEKFKRDEFVVLESGERLKVGRSYGPLDLKGVK